MTTEDIIELVAQAHMAGQHYENSDLDNASYGDARAYAIYTAVPKITTHNTEYPKCKGCDYHRDFCIKNECVKQ